MRKKSKNKCLHLAVSFFKLILGILFLFVGVILSIVFLKQLSSFRIGTNESYFLLGVGAYALIHFLFKKPILLYIFGHELTHAISVFLCRGKVKSFRVSRRGGGVGSTKTNFFISLSPYLFPIYTILAVISYFLLVLFLDVSRYLAVFLFVIGFTWAFHIFLTFYFLGQGQEDVVRSGRIFSLPLIYITNLFVLLIILCCLSKQIAMKDFFRLLIREFQVFCQIF